MSSDTMAIFLDELAKIEIRLAPVIAESVAYYEELLPHLVMGDVVRWMVAHSESDLESCVGLLNFMEYQVVNGADDVQELIVVSGVENIPDPGDAGADLRKYLGPVLRSYDPWNFSTPT